MRLLKFLNELAIKTNIKFLQPVMDRIFKTCVYKPESTILRTLNNEFAQFDISFEPTNRKQSIDTWLAEVGLNYAETDTMPPFKITVYFDDLNIFDDPKYFYLWEEALIRLLRHELLHREQLSRANLNKKLKSFKSRDKYLADTREIMALAHDVYYYLLTKWINGKNLGPQLPKEEFFKRALKEPLNLEDFSNLEEFLELFPNGSKERNRFMKQLYDYFTQQ